MQTKKLIVLLFILFSLSMLPFQTVSANAGPPANIILTVVHNLDDYDIDFLIEPDGVITDQMKDAAARQISEHEGGVSFALDYFKSDRFPRELISFESDVGFVSSTLYGSQSYAYLIPTQSSMNDEYRVYFRVPRVFQIALVSEGEVFTSEVITMTQFDFNITWDVTDLSFEGPQTNVGTIRGLDNHPLSQLTTYVHFFLRLLVTLAIELIVLFFWGFKKKSTWIQVTALNVITQSILTFGTMYVFFITPSNGLLNAAFLFILGELFVFTVEMFYLGVFVSEKSTLSRVGYSFVANFLSLIAGFFLMLALFNL